MRRCPKHKMNILQNKSPNCMGTVAFPRILLHFKGLRMSCKNWTGKMKNARANRKTILRKYALQRYLKTVNELPVSFYDLGTRADKEQKWSICG